MPKSVVFEGKTHIFPDDFTSKDIQDALSSTGASKTSALKAAGMAMRSIPGSPNLPFPIMNPTKVARLAVESLPSAASWLGSKLGAGAGAAAGAATGPAAPFFVPLGTATGYTGGAALFGAAGRAGRNAIAMSPAGEFLGIPRPRSVMEGTGQEALIQGGVAAGGHLLGEAALGGGRALRGAGAGMRAKAGARAAQSVRNAAAEAEPFVQKEIAAKEAARVAAVNAKQAAREAEAALNRSTAERTITTREASQAAARSNARIGRTAARQAGDVSGELPGRIVTAEAARGAAAAKTTEALHSANAAGLETGGSGYISAKDIVDHIAESKGKAFGGTMSASDRANLADEVTSRIDEVARAHTKGVIKGDQPAWDLMQSQRLKQVFGQNARGGHEVIAHGGLPNPSLDRDIEAAFRASLEHQVPEIRGTNKATQNAIIEARGLKKLKASQSPAGVRAVKQGVTERVANVRETQAAAAADIRAMHFRTLADLKAEHARAVASIRGATGENLAKLRSELAQTSRELRTRRTEAVARSVASARSGESPLSLSLTHGVTVHPSRLAGAAEGVGNFLVHPAVVDVLKKSPRGIALLSELMGAPQGGNE